MLQIHRLPVLQDNYIWLLHDPATGVTAAVDPAEAEPVLEALDALGWNLTHILNTHHHWDHTGGNLVLKQQTGCQVYGAERDRDQLPGLDVPLKDGDVVELGSLKAQVLGVPGHTLGHIAYWFEADQALFCGDTLFAGSIGRVDLPGGDYETLLSSIRGVLYPFGDAAVVHPGHGPDTTIGHERRSNPFLVQA